MCITDNIPLNRNVNEVPGFFQKNIENMDARSPGKIPLTAFKTGANQQHAQAFPIINPANPKTKEEDSV
jgi:hypothetical protein